MLGLATEPVVPPASLRDGILAQVAVTPQLPEQPGPSNVTSIFEARVVASAKAPRRWYARPATILAAAAAVVVILLGATVISYVNSATQEQQQAMSVMRISAAADSQHATSAIVGGGTVTVIWSNQLKRSAVVMSDLPALPAGKTYELWYIAGSRITPAGTFMPQAGGGMSQVLKGSMTGGDIVGITIEPAGGSKQPTTKPVVAIPTA